MQRARKLNRQKDITAGGPKTDLLPAEKHGKMRGFVISYKWAERTELGPEREDLVIRIPFRNLAKGDRELIEHSLLVITEEV
jgi:hypothetical protein